MSEVTITKPLLDAVFGALPTRANVVSHARSFLGTSFHHRGRTPGLALDCAGLLVCVGRELGIWEAGFDVPDYTGNPDGSMIPLCDQYLTRIDKATMQPGDVLALITDKDATSSRATQHLGIVADYRHGGLSLIHASNDRLHKKVIETRIMWARNFRFAGAWRFPRIA